MQREFHSSNKKAKRNLHTLYYCWRKLFEKNNVFASVMRQGNV